MHPPPLVQSGDRTTPLETKLPSESLTRAGRILGRKGGAIASRTMTPEQKRARGKKAAAARWAKQSQLPKEKDEHGLTR